MNMHSHIDVHALRPDQQELLMEYLRNNGHMDRWPEKYSLQAGYPPGDVQTYCVNHAEWQKIRLSMKGKYTHEKLKILLDWYESWIDPVSTTPPYAVQCQVGNYLGALRRGGQLDHRNWVRKII